MAPTAGARRWSTESVTEHCIPNWVIVNVCPEAVIFATRAGRLKFRSTVYVTLPELPAELAMNESHVESLVATNAQPSFTVAEMRPDPPIAGIAIPGEANETTHPMPA